MPDMLAGSRIKLERANTHIRELETSIFDFIEREPYRIIVQANRIRRSQQFYTETRELVPYGWGGIIGDAIHNARSSLDLLANVLVDVDGGTPGKAYFPIFNDDETFKSRGLTRIKGISKKTAERLEKIQPYVTGERTLRDLHDLDIIDKHKILVPTAATSVINGFLARQSGTGGTMTAEMRVNTRKIGRQLNIEMPDGIGFKPEHNFTVSTEIVFGDADALPGQPVVPALRRFVTAVEAILDDFDPHGILFARNYSL